MRVESEVAWGPGRAVQSVVLTVRRGGATGASRSVRTTALGEAPERQALGCGEPNGCTTAQAVVAQRAVVRFSPGETQELPLLLASACVGAACTADQRCAEGGRCEVATRAQEGVRTFAGVPIMAGADAGPSDATPVVDVTTTTDAETPPDRAPIADAGTLDHPTPPTDTGSDPGVPTDDAGAPDAGVTDVATTPVDVGTMSTDVPADATADVPADVPTDATAADVGAADAGAICAAPRVLCGSGADARCVDRQSDAADCGSCGVTCPSGSACAGGTCTLAACGMSASDCNGTAADGCEVIHGTALNTCPSAEDLGAFCGDTACGFQCPSRSLQTVATRTGDRSRWFRGRLNECSSCPAVLNGQVMLVVPPGVDYDLFVYSACGVLLGSSRAVAGVTEMVTITGVGTTGSASRDFYAEVRWDSGASCTPWTLTYRARANSATTC